MVVFDRLDRAGAQAHFAAFMAEMDERISWLTEQSAATGGPPAEVLDCSVESLGPLWTWAATRLAWRTGYTPVPLGEVQPHVDLSTVEPLAELPPWFEDVPLQWGQFDAPTLWLVDGFGRYLGQVLVASLEGATWRIGRHRRRGYVFQNHPVVGNVTALGEMDPIRTTFAYVRQQLDGRPYTRPIEHARAWAAQQ